MKADAKKKMRNRLSRIEGQVRGITRLLDEGASLVDIATQTKAVRSALSSIDQLMLEAAFHDLQVESTEETLAAIRYLIKK